jgi:hypothetical protein
MAPMNPRLLRPTASGVFDPRRIAGLAAWYDAADSSTLFDATTGGSLVAASGGVGRWEDKSGNGRHITQGTANNRPSRSTASVSGRDALLFDGNDNLTSGSFSLSQPVTLLAIVRPGNIATRIIVDGAPTGNRLQMAIRSSAGDMRMFAGTILDDLKTVFVTNTTVLASGIFNGASSQQRINAQVNATGNAGTQNLTAGLRVGAAIDGSAGWDGRICEVLYYGGVLSATELNSVESYLMRKWGVT